MAQENAARGWSRARRAECVEAFRSGFGSRRGFQANAWLGLPQPGGEPKGKMCLCVRARVANTKVISPCSFFLSVSGGGGPGGVVGWPGWRLRGRAGAEAGVWMVGGSSESLFHIPGVRAREKTVESTASVSRCRLRARFAPWSGTSVQEAGQAGRGRGAEGRLPALERWGRGRGAAAFPGHCAPADFHGRLPRSRRRRPGAGHSPGFKRHSRNFHLVPPARSWARASPTTGAQGAWYPAPDPETRRPDPETRRPDPSFDAGSPGDVCSRSCSSLGWQC
ncbi:hypothetical protein A6R68_14819 [Neotoma lepida]|uniref:Uncharacterized protein n=1 Tax=Neotoma lepida TaxID=56216 RepID=A0A1A6HAJ7_NEOLE|nr:hypothetical protein A6R68_14819 [Neotoma lepida]